MAKYKRNCYRRSRLFSIRKIKRYIKLTFFLTLFACLYEAWLFLSKIPNIKDIVTKGLAVAIAVCLMGLVIKIIRHRAKDKYTNKFSKVKNWKEFEGFVARRLDELGYEAYTSSEATKRKLLPPEILASGGDGGVDGIAFKGDELHVIQCKYYKYGNNVGSPELNKLVGSCRFFSLKYPNHKIVPVFLTTSSYTRDAIAQKTGLKLYDHKTLEQYLGFLG